MITRNFEERLKGGHPNSLGNTIEVVEEVLQNHSLFEELFNCYFSDDEIVRLRVSNGVKRVSKVERKLVVDKMDDLLSKISQIDQASTQWTLSWLFGFLAKDMSTSQLAKATSIMKNNLANHNDWIVLNNTMDTLGAWSKKDEELREWIQPHLERLSKDKRNSVSARGKKWLKALQ